YDPALAAAVGAFQRRHGLAADGIIGPQTLAALNVPADQRALQVTLNLERWRWLPREPGPRHLLVNIPDFSLALVEDGVPTLTMRAVVGRPDRPTPVVSGLMQWLVINPGWSVPQKLAREDLLPKLAADPGYLLDRGFRVYADWRPGAAEIDPAGVDWRAIDPLHLGFKFFQAPGPRNPLGRVKFMFPNDFSVYIHDTDQRGVFAQDQRCFSAGCVRIEAPDDLLQRLALRGNAPAEAAVQTAMAGNKSVGLALAEALPVHLVYLTAWVETDGTLQFRRDCYGYDGDLAAALVAGARAPVAPHRPLPPAVIARAAAPAPTAAHQVRTGPVSMWTKREAE
ncbi:MAG: L,D-transpeptidase family protein, partial [Krumholzibacteria bacterium]|nr:L,D-transpeptidase family protein [Candidatus Krumholzibacteria bacterium]